MTTDTAKARARRAWSHGRALAIRAVKGHLDDHGPQFAAAISYYVLFSLFPLAILLVAVAGLVLRDDSVRDALVDTIVANVPLSEDGAGDVEAILENVASGASGVGVLGLIGLAWSASGLMGTIRVALSVVWGAEPRPFVRGKLIDFAMLVAAGVLVLLSLGLTVAARVVADVSEPVADALARIGWGPNTIEVALGFLAPFLLSLVTFGLAYRLIPSATTTLRSIWPGILVAAVGFEGAKHLFALYLENFGRYEAVYGSIGAIVALQTWLYLSAYVFVFGAELNSEVEHQTAEDSTTGKPLPMGRRGAWAADHVASDDETGLEPGPSLAEANPGAVERREERKEKEERR